MGVASFFFGKCVLSINGTQSETYLQICYNAALQSTNYLDLKIFLG